jgi:hypothetical protein
MNQMTRKVPDQAHLTHNSLDLTCHDHSSSAGDDEQHGQKEHEGKVIAYLPNPCSGLLDAPDLVEALFDIGKDLQNGPDEERETDPRHQASPGVFKQAVGKAHDLTGDLTVGAENLAYFLFQRALETESLGHTESHGHNGNDGQEGVKGEGTGAKLALVLDEPAEGQQYDPENTDEEPDHR